MALWVTHPGVGPTEAFDDFNDECLHPMEVKMCNAARAVHQEHDVGGQRGASCGAAVGGRTVQGASANPYPPIDPIEPNAGSSLPRRSHRQQRWVFSAPCLPHRSQICPADPISNGIGSFPPTFAPQIPVTTLGLLCPVLSPQGPRTKAPGLHPTEPLCTTAAPRVPHTSWGGCLGAA